MRLSSHRGLDLLTPDLRSLANRTLDTVTQLRLTLARSNCAKPRSASCDCLNDNGNTRVAGCFLRRCWAADRMPDDRTRRGFWRTVLRPNRSKHVPGRHNRVGPLLCRRRSVCRRPTLPARRALEALTARPAKTICSRSNALAAMHSNPRIGAASYASTHSESAFRLQRIQPETVHKSQLWNTRLGSGRMG